MNANSNTLDGDWRRLDDYLTVLRGRAERLIDLGYARGEATRLAPTSDTSEG